MNEFYEAVSNLFEELRCDSGEREYTVQPWSILLIEVRKEYVPWLLILVKVRQEKI